MSLEDEGVRGSGERAVAPGPVLGPPQGRGHRSVVRLTREWYVACRSDELGGGEVGNGVAGGGSLPERLGRRSAPLAMTVAGVPLVLFRDGTGRASALLDRCAHRNVPLSLGRVTREGTLECGYHGWRFTGEGRCSAIPGLCSPLEKVYRVPSYATREQDGFVWVCPEPDVIPERDPLRVPALDDSRYEHVVRRVEVRASLHAAIENALDVPHTGYLHRGLFRGGKKNRIRAVVRRYRDRVEAEYLGEPKPPGVVAKILAPHGGGIVRHWDRFFLPGVAQVEYALGEDTHLVVTSFCTPVEDFHTIMFAVVSFRTPLPGALVRRVLEPVARRIFGQDAAILAKQTEAIERFGGEQFVSTEIDVLGPSVWRLLRDAERAEQAASAHQGTPRHTDGGGAAAAHGGATRSIADEPVVHAVDLEV